MYAKIFTAIFDSSLAENYEVRHVFEDLLKMADRTGAVNMTQEAIARRANVPLEKIRTGIEELCKPDLRSQNKEHEGRRLIPLAADRDWGWQIVSYTHYRAVQDRDALRESWRLSQAKIRKKKGKKVTVKPPKESLSWSAGTATEKAFIQADGDGLKVAASQIVDRISQPATTSPTNENTSID